ncbi:MAG: response regulator [Candidatus Sumerlaeaceae bacterium]
MLGKVETRMRESVRALLVGIDNQLADALVRGGSEVGVQVRCSFAAQPTEARALLDEGAVDIVFVDADEVGADFCDLVKELVGAQRYVPCAVVTEVGDEELWVRALSAGAVDLIEKPFLNQALKELVRKTRQSAVA